MQPREVSEKGLFLKTLSYFLRVIRSSQGCSSHFSHRFLNREMGLYHGVRKETLRSLEN